MPFIILLDFDYDDANEKITANYVKLTKLPINSILCELREKKVITLKEKETMETMTSESARMQHLLDKIIVPSLSNKIGIKFKNFLEIMEKSEDVMFTSMAQNLGMHIEYIVM